MPDDMLITHLPLLLRPDPRRVVIRPFVPAEAPASPSTPGRPHAQRIADRVLSLSEGDLHDELGRVMASLTERHRDLAPVFERRFREVDGLLIDPCSFRPEQALLIGAYFSEEYAFEAAALFNPSIVPHPDQTGVAQGGLRFVLSLRGVGEGHLSSILFRTGVCGSDGAVTVDPPGLQAVAPRIESITGGIPDDAGVRLFRDLDHDLSELVISPMTMSQRHGIEDLRLVRFIEDDGVATYLGAYTASSGEAIQQELLRTTDFETFDMTPLRGDVRTNKGMALFPRRIGGRYAMLGRLDHENIWYLTSDDLSDWRGGAVAVSPRWSWEFIQMGNCGSPMEIDEGWLVITHGVGAVRNYCIGACLLDRDDPTKVLARTPHPIIRPGADERYGYVPNIAYTCGAMIHDRLLVLPYALADNYTTFATVPLDRLLSAMA